MNKGIKRKSVSGHQVESSFLGRNMKFNTPKKFEKEIKEKIKEMKSIFTSSDRYKSLVKRTMKPCSSVEANRMISIIEMLVDSIDNNNIEAAKEISKIAKENILEFRKSKGIDFNLEKERSDYFNEVKLAILNEVNNLKGALKCTQDS